MSKSLKILLIGSVVIMATALILMFDVPPPPDDAMAQRRGEPSMADNFDTYQWASGVASDTLELTHPANWFRICVKLAAQAADSVDVSIHETYSGEWTTLKYPGATSLSAIYSFDFYGPEIDSVIVTTGTAACCMLDYWW